MYTEQSDVQSTVSSRCSWVGQQEHLKYARDLGDVSHTFFFLLFFQFFLVALCNNYTCYVMVVTHIVVIVEFGHKSILTTFQKEKKSFFCFVFQTKDCFIINYAHQAHPEVD